MANERIYAVAIIALFAGLMVELYYPGGIAGILTPTEPEPPTTTPEGVETSQFKFTPVRKDATATAITSATVRIWYDGNGDGKMQYTELGLFTESSGTYTSVNEYPIGDEYKFWVQVQESSHFTRYIQMYMSGSRNSDGSAKTAQVAPGSTIEVCQIDDSVTYAGLIRGTAWAKGTDYNYTANGATGIAEIRTTLSAADKGIESEIWEQVNYKTIYSGLGDDTFKTHDYWVKWDEISSAGIAKFYAPTFLGIHMTIQDGIDLGLSSSDFDVYANDGTNKYYGAYALNWADYFYRSSDDAAPIGVYQFSVDIDAAGAALYVGFYTDVEYADMIEGQWPYSTAANYLGTISDDWDWVA